MRVGRLELPRAQCSTDFKSGASTDSAILARHYTYPYAMWASHPVY